MTAVSAATVVVIAGTVLLASALLLVVLGPVTAPGNRSPAATRPARPAPVLGALRHRPTLVLVTLAACGTFGFGALRIATAASATHLVLVSSIEVVTMLVGAGLDTLVGLAVIIVAIGMLGGVRDTIIATLTAETTSSDHHTEGFAWLTTFMWAGYGAGTAVGGALTGSAEDGDAALAAAAAIAALALTIPRTGTASAGTEAPTDDT